MIDHFAIQAFKLRRLLVDFPHFGDDRGRIAVQLDLDVLAHPVLPFHHDVPALLAARRGQMGTSTGILLEDVLADLALDLADESPDMRIFSDKN